jgi:hypothetical protein
MNNHNGISYNNKINSKIDMRRMSYYSKRKYIAYDNIISNTPNINNININIDSYILELGVVVTRIQSDRNKLKYLCLEEKYWYSIFENEDLSVHIRVHASTIIHKIVKYYYDILDNIPISVSYVR